MKREFIYLHHFDRCWKALHLSDEEQREMENNILEQPDIGKLIPGTGGLRKARFETSNSGKSGGIRVLYVDFESYKKTYPLYAYKKSEKETITEKQKKDFKNLIEILLNELKTK